MSTFSERLRHVLDHYSITGYRLAKETTLTNMSVANILTGKFNPSYGFICTLLERFPEVNANWILLGRESMFLDPQMNPVVVSHTSADLLEAKNSVIAAQGEIIRMKDEKIELLMVDLLEFRAAATLVRKKEDRASGKAKKGG